MHILIVSQYFHPEVGATQTRMLEFARALAREGHRLTVLTEFPNHPHGRIPAEYRGKIFTRETFEGFDIVRVWVRASESKSVLSRLAFYFSFTFMAFVRGLFLFPRPDVVLATSPPLFSAAAGRALSFAYGAKFILDIRDLWPKAAEALGMLADPRFIKPAEWLERFLYRRADRITAVTKGFCAHIASLVPRGEEKIEWLPNGAATDIFSPEKTDPGLRGRLGLEGKFIVTFAGTHGIAQGLPAILEAARLLRDDPGVVFLFLGEGPVKEALVEAAREGDLSNVRFHPGVPTDEAAPFVNMSDLLLVPLKNDPEFRSFIPSKLFDFMACARPIVLSVDGEARAILEEAGAGVWIPAEDPRALAEAIADLRGDEEKRAEMGRRGREFVLQSYTRERQNERLIGIIGEMADRR
jgi:glycosyltransferase involved in cell wall biosynthesis